MKKKKTVKAWAIVNKKPCEVLMDATYDGAFSYAVHATKEEACKVLSIELYPEGWRVLPCTITYEI